MSAATYHLASFSPLVTKNARHFHGRVTLIIDIFTCTSNARKGRFQPRGISTAELIPKWRQKDEG